MTPLEGRPVMNKISLIIRREYLTRIRKKSFIIMSVLGPLIFAAYILIPMYFATLEDKEEKTMVVIDDSGLFTERQAEGPVFTIPGTETLKFQVVEGIPIEIFRETFEESGYYGLLFIPSNILASESSLIYSTKQTSLEISEYLERSMESEIEHLKLAQHEISDIEKILAEVETNINVRNIKWTKDGETQESNTGVIMAIGYLGGMLIFFFIFFFGSQVMRGVIEEKVSRIIEVIVSSVKPFQLMMGKIIGVGLTGLTQFLIWMIFSAALVTGLKAAFFPELNRTPTEQVVSSGLFDQGTEVQAPGMESPESLAGEDMLQEIFVSLQSIHAGVMIGSFLFYFIFGYLLYAAMFAVIGSAVDNETDTQQLIFPVILPLILGLYVMISAINNPDNALSFWFSIIPFTSPVVMMVRIPFGVPWWQVAVSGTLLVATFIGMTWVAGKVYRTGILMYGKKNSYKEIWKWLRYSS
ncbi:MAG: ABC transporter permease [Bacteroidales bacterium]|nr:ABC transporter permease [Bacteroidales bacterium]